MKPRLIAVVCVFIVAMLSLPMTVLAGSMRLNAWPGSSLYYAPTTVDIYAVWNVDDPSDFEHDYCYVLITIYSSSQVPPWDSAWGEYDAMTGKNGEVDVQCASDDGDAQFDWPVGDDEKGYDFFAEVYVYARDDGPPEREVEDTTCTGMWVVM
jgi:hypothetical protein